MNGLPSIHPSEIIKEDILPSTRLSVTAAAKALGVSRQMLHDILAGRKPLSTVMCLKVSRLFGGTPELWMRLQAAYDLEKAEQKYPPQTEATRVPSSSANSKLRKQRPNWLCSSKNAFLKPVAG